MIGNTSMEFHNNIKFFGSFARIMREKWLKNIALDELNIQAMHLTSVPRNLTSEKRRDSHVHTILLTQKIMHAGKTIRP